MERLSMFESEENKSKQPKLPSKILHVDNLGIKPKKDESYLIEYNDNIYYSLGRASKNCVEKEGYNIIEELDFNETVMNLDKVNDKLFETIMYMFEDIAQETDKELAKSSEVWKWGRSLNLGNLFDFLEIFRYQLNYEGKAEYVGLGSACAKLYADYVFKMNLRNGDKDDYLKLFEPLFSFSESHGYVDKIKNEIKEFKFLNKIPRNPINTFTVCYDIISKKTYINVFEYYGEYVNNPRLHDLANEMSCILGFISVDDLFNNKKYLNNAMDFIENCFKKIKYHVEYCFDDYKELEIFKYILGDTTFMEEHLNSYEMKQVKDINSYYCKIMNGDNSYFKNLLDNIIQLFKFKYSNINTIKENLSSNCKNVSTDGELLEEKLTAINNMDEIFKVFIKYSENKSYDLYE